jgi:hypothetical protein
MTLCVNLHLLLDYETCQIQDIKRLFSSIAEQLSRVDEKPAGSRLYIAVLAIFGGVALLLHGLLLCSSHIISAIFHSMAQAPAADPKSVDIQLDVAAVNKSPKADLFTDNA